MNSLPSTNYIPLDDVGSNDSDLKSPKIIRSFWKPLSIFLALGLTLSLIYIANIRGLFDLLPNQEPETVEPKKEIINTSKSADKLYQNYLAAYLWPNGHYLPYSIQDPVNYNLTIFVESKDLNPQTFELLKLEAFAGEITGVIGSRTPGLDSKFILVIHVGDMIKFYLTGLEFDETTKKLRAFTPSELNFDTTLMDLENYSYYFDVLSWVDNEKIIVKETYMLNSNPLDVTTKYWVAPATNLNQRTNLEFN